MSSIMASFIPLATRMRPKNLDEYVGQSHLLAKGKPIASQLAQGHLMSMIFWGPPGVGKTTLAHILSDSIGAHFVAMSAVLAGVKEVRIVVADAQQRLVEQKMPTVLFIDEIHRFNKAQQDAFLPHVEAGTIILIGATTENPSFHLNNALLSRARVYVLKALSEDELKIVMDHALTDKIRGLGEMALMASEAVRAKLIQAADGDARQLLGLLELAADFADNAEIKEEALATVMQASLRRFDNKGDAFYDQISAMHKSVRGSDPDASLYWFVRMIDGGCDPYYIARRIIRMASEDIGNADPRGLTLALNAWEAYERLGSPEGELALAQALVYLACAPKSNAVYKAYNDVTHDMKVYGSLPVPLHICNAPTKMMKALDYHKNYRYAHDEPDAFAAGETYLPEGMPQKYYYEPVERGLEIKIREKLLRLRQLNNHRIKTEKHQ
ncbi:MAG: recombination factor protein RarA [Gammaproteobacteria bacterium RIFCSPHIGHO2_12_FULL_41_15]|nr:MAG: recombination factor protein RarA [Gammaproteobacteria bacterium RIFCSPHIGHO2_12_FULL_41_15]